MINWEREWVTCDPNQCWVELMAIWASVGFKSSLRMGEERAESEMNSEEELVLICWSGEEAELSH